MKCQWCGLENSPNSCICNQCGGSLLAYCTQCNSANPLNGKFCCECGAALQPLNAVASQPAAIRWLGVDKGEERRQLTILFCDLVGVTNLASVLDPEDLQEIIEAYHACAREIVERHSGVVAQYLGDGILAYFGYPSAHEDDAERAVRAGLELVDAIGKLQRQNAQLSARVGIATGLTVIADVGERQRSALGETPNLAARLQAIAEPGTVVISELTRRLIADLYECRDLGAVELKGFARPVRASQVVIERQVESRFDAARPISTALVGREEEYASLQRLWNLASQGRGQVVCITGEPGIGKSRLVAALEESLLSRNHKKLRFACSPQFTASFLRPVINMIERISEFHNSDTAEEKLTKLELMLGPAPIAGEELALIAELVSVPLPTKLRSIEEISPQQKRERTLDVLVQRVFRRAQVSPLLVVWDDVHWIDATSQELLEKIIKQICCVPILLVITSREGLPPSWSDLPQLTFLPLERLSAAQIAAVATQVTGGKELPSNLMEQIAARADGVPLFVEELTKTMIESAFVKEQDGQYVLTGQLPLMAVPSTLQASLLARLDRLSSVREIAQVCAAIGREFPLDLLLAVTGINESALNAALMRLCDAQLISVHDTRAGTIYAFKHALVQNAAYSMLVREKRRLIHAKIADALERTFPQVVATQPETLAQHFENAEDFEKAVHYYQCAANFALSRCAATESVGHADKGLELVKRIQDNKIVIPLELQLELSRGRAMIPLHGEFAEQTGAAFFRARELCCSLGNTEFLFEVLDGLCVHHFSRRELDRTITVSQELLALGEEQKNNKVTITGLRAFASAAFLQGKFTEARNSLEHLLNSYRSEQDADLAARTRVDPEISSLSYLSLCTLVQGYVNQSNAYSEQCLRVAHSRNHPDSLIFTLRLAAFRAGLIADWSGMLAFASELLREAEKFRFLVSISEANFFLAWASFQLCQDRSRITEMRTSLGNFSAGRPIWPYYQCAIAAAEASVGNYSEAEALFIESLQIAEEHEERWYIAEIIRQHAETRLNSAMGPREFVEQQLRSALDVARQQGAKLWQLRSASSLATHWMRQRRYDEATDLMRSVCADWPEKINASEWATYCERSGTALTSGLVGEKALFTNSTRFGMEERERADDVGDTISPI